MNTYRIIEEMARGADFSDAPEPVQRYVENIQSRLNAGGIPSDVEIWMEWRFDRANSGGALRHLVNDITEMLGGYAREVLIRDIAITVLAHLNAIQKEEIPSI